MNSDLNPQKNEKIYIFFLFNLTLRCLLPILFTFTTSKETDGRHETNSTASEIC